MMCPFCSNIIIIKPSPTQVAEKQCNSCEAVIAVYVVSPPKITNERLVEVRNRNT